MMCKLKHPYIIKIFGWIWKPLCMIVEIASNGDLRDVYRGKRGHYKLDIGVRVCYHAALAVLYMHSWQPNPIIHRDIKSDNILVNEAFEGRLADCGMSKELGLDLEMTQHVGSPVWEAPELLRGGPYDEVSAPPSLHPHPFPLSVLSFCSRSPTIPTCGTAQNALDR